MNYKKKFYQIYKHSGLFSFKCFLVKTTHRILLERILKRQAKKLSINRDYKIKNIIDYGCGIPRYKSLFPNSEWQYFDKYPKHKEVKYASVDNIPVDNIDVLICIEVLEYLNYDETTSLIKEIMRVIDNRGFAILTTPFLFPIPHNEILRIANPDILKNILTDKYTLEFLPFGNLFSIIHDTIFKYNSLIDFRLARLLFNFLLLPLKILSFLAEHIHLLKLPSGYIIIINSAK